jgi:hypothetical protein
MHSMLDLDVGLFSGLLEHKGAVDLLHGALSWLRTYQRGLGVVAVSPRCDL